MSTTESNIFFNINNNVNLLTSDDKIISNLNGEVDHRSENNFISIGEANFSYFDYAIFFSMLAISGFIGLYYGFFSKRKQDNPNEYILGNKQMPVFPVASSLIVSHISGTSMLGLPADVYAHGTQYVMSFICLITVGLSLIYIYIPVFYELNFASCFTYLEKRFDRKVRVTASVVYALDCILGLPIVIYVPALALNQVTGINIHFITITICLLCVFYTTVGGFRAVVWTDTIQCISIVGSLVAVIVIGTYYQGGLKNIFEAAERGRRLQFFNMDPNPLNKSSLWTVSLGLSVLWASRMSANQGTIQRILSLPNKQKGTRCVWIFCTGIAFMKTAGCYLGVLMYATYENCDPYSVGVVKKLDQMIPYYTMTVARNIPGLAGLFIAGIFAAALSSMSSNLNSLSATIYEDLIEPHIHKIGEKAVSNIMKVTVVSLGILVLFMVFVVEKLGTILQLSYSLHGLTAGTLVGIFTIGMLSPKINTKGIICGAVASLIVVGIILVGAQSSPKLPHLPFNTHECGPSFMNETFREPVPSTEYENVPWPFRINFMYYSFIGMITLIIFAYPTSIATGGCGNVDENLLAPFARKKRKENIEIELERVPLKG